MDNLLLYTVRNSLKKICTLIGQLTRAVDVMIVRTKRINLHFDDQSTQIAFFIVCGKI